MRKFIVAKPNLHIKQDGNLVKLEVGTEYECDESDAKNWVKSKHLVVAAEVKKVKSQSKKVKKEKAY